MACKENAEKDCKSYPKCDGCGANVKSHNMTQPCCDGTARTYADTHNPINIVRLGPDSDVYRVTGKIVDRLHEFEKLGYEPEDLKRIVERHHEMNRYSRDAFDALYYVYKTTREIDNSSSNTLSPSGFINEYVKNEAYRKLVTKRIKRVMGKMTPLRDAINEKIVEAITRDINYQKIWVTTSSNTNGPSMDKLKEAMKKAKEYRECIDKLYDSVSKHTGIPRSMLDKQYSECFTRLFEIDEMHEVPADWKPTGINLYDPLKWKYSDCGIGKVNNVEQDKDGIKMNVVFKNTYDATRASSIETSPSKIGAQLGEIARKAFDEGIDAALKRPIRSGRYPWDIQKIINKEKKEMFKIKRVLFNNPATIVFWADGDKTVVKCQNGEPYDPEKGLAMAISKKALGNGRGYYDEFTKQLGRGQKHSAPEQFNSEVCHIQKLEDLKAAEEDNKTNRALAVDALDYLKKAFINPKSTKADLMHGMAKAMECVNAILDNY